MTLRSKIRVFVFFFLILTAAFAVGSFVIFSHLRDNFEVLTFSAEEHNLYEDLVTAIKSLSRDAKGWALTGDVKFKTQYRKDLSEAYASLSKLGEVAGHTAAVESARTDFEDLKSLTTNLIIKERPPGTRETIGELRILEQKEEELGARLHASYLASTRGITRAIAEGERIKNEVVYYLAALLIMISLGFVLLVLFMRKVISVPFHDILTATDRITSGDLKYRISSKRTDEFGVIADRFDSMVDELQKISAENEDLYLSTRNQLQKLTTIYELAKALTSTLDLNELLEKMAEESTHLLRSRGCIIRLIEGDKLMVKASAGIPKEKESMLTLSIGEGLPGKVAEGKRPILVGDLSAMPPEWKIPNLDARSVMNVPLLVGETVIGTFALYDKMATDGEIVPFSGDDLSTAEGFASLCGIAIAKAKAYEVELRKEREALEAKKKLDILFESVQGGIMNLGKDFTILSVNRFVEHLVGIPSDELLGKSSLDVFHGKKGICPHCVARVTLETGEINTITQVSGLNYAELTSYPIKDDNGGISECVVYIQDITDRVLYQEEMLALYREGTQTREYLESLIDNSADAIVTSDLNGFITSWNQGAEKIYGFADANVMGRFLPFVPEWLRESEKTHTERVRNGEVLKDIETVRLRQDGTLIEVSLTLSPIKDAAGEIIGISGISRDISEKKRVEKELITKNQELSRLFFISSAMRSTLDLERLLRMILTAVTMGEGLSFNRAVLFLVDEERNVLKGAMGVGPESHEEAGKIWERLSREKRSLSDIMGEIDMGPVKKESFLDRLSVGIEVPLDSDSILAVSVREKRPFKVSDARQEPSSNAVLIQQFGTEAYAVVPLISRDKVIGILWVDNLFNKRPVTEEDMKFLVAFSNQVATAIESAKLFEEISIAEAELENVFRSISDMVYFTDMDYTIKSINKAVADRFGKDEKALIGKKCYEVFHGLNTPWKDCPHHRTVQEKKAFVEELEDPFLGGTFLTSTSPIFDRSGNFMGTVHIVRDITEIKNIQERLSNAERMAALGEVAAKVAHEIRNPLVSIGGFALRLEKKLDGNLKEYAMIIANEVRRLEEILKDILGFVREVRLSKTTVDVNELLANILSLVDSEIRERGIAVGTSFGEVATSLLDPDRIREAFLNIVNNAIQAVGTHGEITVKTYQKDDFVIAEVSDTGAGIDEKDLPFIFDPFYTTKPTGTGLGLAITRRVIEEHKGRVEVKSKSGAGTTIKVFLPKGKEVS